MTVADWCLCTVKTVVNRKLSDNKIHSFSCHNCDQICKNQPLPVIIDFVLGVKINSKLTFGWSLENWLSINYYPLPTSWLTLRGRLSRIRDNGNIVTRTIVTNSWRKRIRQKDWLQLLATPRHACHSCQGGCRRVVETKELLDRLFRDISTVAWQRYDREKRLNAWWRPALESRSSGWVPHKNERLCSGTLF